MSFVWLKLYTQIHSLKLDFLGKGVRQKMQVANYYWFQTFLGQTFTGASILGWGFTSLVSSFLTYGWGFTSSFLTCGWAFTSSFLTCGWGLIGSDFCSILGGLPLVMKFLVGFLFQKSGKRSSSVIGSSKNSSASSRQKLTSLPLYFSPYSLSKPQPDFTPSRTKYPFPLNCFFSFSKNITFKMPATLFLKQLNTSILLLRQGRFLKLTRNGCPAGQLLRMETFLASLVRWISSTQSSSSTKLLGPPNSFSSQSSSSSAGECQDRDPSEWQSSESEGGLSGRPSELQQFPYQSNHPPNRSNLKTTLQPLMVKPEPSGSQEQTSNRSGLGGILADISQYIQLSTKSQHFQSLFAS